MYFSLTNAPTIFIDLTNRVFHKCLDKFVIVFADNISIFSGNVELNEEHLTLELEVLNKNQPYAKVCTCVVWMKEFLFLSHQKMEWLLIYLG